METLNKQSLLAILEADVDGRLLDLPYQGRVCMGQEWIITRMRNFWGGICDELMGEAADRLLQPGLGEMPVLPLELVRERAVAFARNHETFRMPDDPDWVVKALVEPMIDLVLSMGLIVDPQETRFQRLKRVHAIIAIAKSYRVRAEEFLREIPQAADLVLFLTSTPEVYRARELARVDARHPARVEELMNVFVAGVRMRVSAESILPHGPVEIAFQIPSVEVYWERRAMKLQAIESRIAHVWPGCAQGGIQSMEYA